MIYVIMPGREYKFSTLNKAKKYLGNEFIFERNWFAGLKYPVYYAKKKPARESG